MVNRLYDQVDYLLNENGVSRTDYVSKTVVLERIERLLAINQIQAFLYHHFLKPVSILWQENVANSYSEMIQKVAEYIHSDFRNEQISLEYVADRFEVDPIFLSKEFKRAKQVNFIDYLTNVRIVEAKRQLLETDHQINEIAENLGYNPSYFNRLFKSARNDPRTISKRSELITVGCCGKARIFAAFALIFPCFRQQMFCIIEKKAISNAAYVQQENQWTCRSCWKSDSK